MTEESLPPGASCGDCADLPFCRWHLRRQGHETICDWTPSRFTWATGHGPLIFDPRADCYIDGAGNRHCEPDYGAPVG